MSSRDMAINIVNMMDDDQIDNFVKLFRPIVSDIPNEETLRAIEETEEMLKLGDTKKFDSLKELFEDLAS